MYLVYTFCLIFLILALASRIRDLFSPERRIWKEWVKEAEEEAKRNRTANPAVTVDTSRRTVSKVAVSPDIKYFAYSGGEGNYIHLIELETGRHVWTYGGSLDPVFAMEFTPDGNFIAAGDWYFGRVYFYRLGTKGLSELDVSDDGDVIAAIAFSPDGKTLACTSDRISL